MKKELDEALRQLDLETRTAIALEKNERKIKIARR